MRRRNKLSNITSNRRNRFHRTTGSWTSQNSTSSSWRSNAIAVLLIIGLCSVAFFVHTTSSGASTYSDRQDSIIDHQSLRANDNSNIEHACKFRNYEKYNELELNIKGPNSTITANCLSFNCTKNNIQLCDNTRPTNYDGSEPPCCTHILRDMARVFDDAMCDLGLDYVSSFGALLGLTRSDRFIPWSVDIDYILRSKRDANALVDLWDTNTTGMAHVFQNIPRMCATAGFGEGKLRKWAIPAPKNTTLLDGMGFPYIDLYVGRTTLSNLFSEIHSCVHKSKDVWPSKRVLVYNKTIFQRIPANTENMLWTYYGPKWRTPDKQENPHGENEPCRGWGNF